MPNIRYDVYILFFVVLKNYLKRYASQHKAKEFFLYFLLSYPFGKKCLLERVVAVVHYHTLCSQTQIT